MHPHPIPAVIMMSHVSKLLKLPVVSQYQWLQCLERSVRPEMDSLGNRHNPAVRLLPFFRSIMSEATQNPAREAFNMPPAATSNAQSGAPSLIHAQALGEDDIRSWIEFWQCSGFFEGEGTGSAKL